MEIIDLTEAHQTGVSGERLRIVIDLTQDDEIPYLLAGASLNRDSTAPAGTTLTNVLSQGFQCRDCNSLIGTGSELFEYRDCRCLCCVVCFRRKRRSVCPLHLRKLGQRRGKIFNVECSVCLETPRGKRRVTLCCRHTVCKRDFLRLDNCPLCREPIFQHSDRPL
ncbi:hypothetical protein LY76DRAFT_416856 [Colletotrichum caudatum]|nr:hypothetical protein LY76DRAFT_416856 [Colletotrichum caudatum]